MKSKRLFLFVVFFSLLLIPACQKEAPVNQNRVVAAISSDIESVNPLFAFDLNEGNISELLYSSLVQHGWNYQKGSMDTFPMLAKSWQWSKDSSSITLELRNDVKWSDGQQFTANDVIFSFDLYSDPLVQSKLYGSFKNFYTDSSQHINLQKTFTVTNPYLLTINFKKNSTPSFYDIDFPIIPEHVYKNINRKDLVTAEKEIKPVTNGAFYLAAWNKNQSIILKADTTSFLYKPGNVSEIIFKIVPDYNSRLTQLKQGDLDIVEDIKADDYPSLKKNNNLDVTALKDREYDYVGWNNIDPNVYKTSKKIVPNKLFGDPVVREALTYAINKNEILSEFLNNHGDLASGPISPIFKTAIDTTLTPLPYNVEKAKELLASAGWKDEDQSGVLKKNGQIFSFTLYIPAGNPRRDFAATVIKNNLQAVGIKVKIEKLEPEVFFQKMYGREFNAWMAGWTISIPIDLKPFWYSDFAEAPLNVECYQNKTVDGLIDKIEKTKSEEQRNLLYKKFQAIIYKDQPVTFLYWVDKLIAYNKKIQNFTVSPLGTFHRAWLWSIK